MTWLIASMGTSPAVLTEAIWYLEHQKGLEVDRFTCVGTQASRDEAEAKLFAPDGALARLRTCLDKPADWLTAGQGYAWEGEPLEAIDNRDLEEARAMDRACRRAVREAQEKGDGPVVACISGGRKTMSSSLQQAMTLLARPQDWAFHVLLRVPEGQDEFAVQKSGFAFPGDPIAPQYPQVGVDAFEIPIVRLLDFAMGHKLDNLLKEDLIQALQRVVDQATTIPRLGLEFATRRLFVAWGEEASHPVGDPLSVHQALMLATWIQAGEPRRRQEAVDPMEEIIERMKQARLIGVTEEEELSEAIDRWLKADSKTFGPIQTGLNARILGLHPALERFTLKSRWGKSGPLGFSDEVYSKGLIAIR